MPLTQKKKKKPPHPVAQRKEQPMIPNVDPSIRAFYDGGSMLAVLAWSDQGEALVASPVQGILVPAQDADMGEFLGLVGLGREVDRLTLASTFEVTREVVAKALRLDSNDDEGVFSDGAARFI